MVVTDIIQQPGKWNSELIHQYYLIPDSQRILSIPLSPLDHTDSWLWHYSKNGSYSVKSGYNLAISNEKSGPSSSYEVISAWWKAFRAIKIPRKILMFAWKGYHEILLTIKGLYHKNISTHNNYPLCGFGEDSNAHIVFWCLHSQKVWDLLEYDFLVRNKEDISFKYVLLYAYERLEKEDFAKMLITTWGIWTKEIKKTHGQHQRNPQQLLSWLASYLEDLRKAHSQENGRLSRREPSSKDNMEFGIDDLTLFVDAAISTSSQKIGLGAIIVSPNKKIQAALLKPIEGNLSVVHAEALAMLVGIQWDQQIGLLVKRISTDSLSLAQALNNNKEYQNELGIFLDDIRSLLINSLSTYITHVRHKFNSTTHNMAKHALQLEEEVAWMEDIPYLIENHV